VKKAFLLVAVLAVAAENSVANETGVTPLEQLTDGWNMILPGGETRCIYGSDYGFFVQPKDPKKVLITFPGGGACWSGLTCSDEPAGRLGDNPRTVTTRDSPAGRNAGIFADDNPENPFLNFTKIHLGYCTGDMHIGDAVVHHNDAIEAASAQARETLYFNGYQNAMAVLRWVFENVPSPETVVVGGFTSGSYGTPLYASLLADHYPDANVRHMGDGNGALFIGDNLRPLPEAWNTLGVLRRHEGFDMPSLENFSFEDITIAAARRHPEVVFTQMITANDQTLSELIAYLGVKEPILSGVEAGQRYVKAQVPNYKTYIASGRRHVISLGYFDAIAPTGNRNRGLPVIYDRFYSYQVDGRRYRDWIADLVEGRPLEDVHCTNCDEPEYWVPPP